MADRNKQELRGAAGIDRRGLLKCMTWAGTGVVWSLSGGVPRTIGLIGSAAAAETAANELTFVQISDNHIGFHLPPNPDPTATLGEAIAKIKAMPAQPAFIVHTGDISHLSKPEQWDNAEQVIKGANKQVFYIPGEHDVADAGNGKAYLERFGKNTQGKGWYSFDYGRGAFYRADQCFRFPAGLQISRPRQTRRRPARMAGKGCRGTFGEHTDRRARSSSAVDDLRTMGLGHRRCRPRPRLSEALRLGDRAERPHPSNHAKGRRQRHLPHRGSTAFPQPAPGTAPAPGPMKQVQAGDLRKYLGVRTVDYVRSNGAPALTDSTLAG